MFRKLFILAAIAAAAITMTVPALADTGGWESIGPRLSLVINPPTTWTANTPFHTESGFGCLQSDGISTCADAGTHVDLYVDGVLQTSRVDIDNSVSDGVHVLFRRDVTSFPAGLSAGTHTFVADFYLDGTLLFTQTDVILFQ